MIPENLTTSQPAMKTPHQRPGNFQSHEESRGKAAEKHRLMGVQMVRSAAFSKSPRPRNSQAPYMTDCCQDKTSPYEIRPEEKDLFAAAIVFGDWLAEFPAASRNEIAAIRKMQTFLRNLPSAPSPNFNAEYVFRIETSNEDVGHFGWWSVSVCRAMLEITCCGHEIESEFAWLLCPGWKNNNDLRIAKDWMRQVSEPLKLIGDEQSIVIQSSKWSVLE